MSTIDLSFLELIKGIDDHTPSVVLHQIAEFCSIPHSHLSREQLMVNIEKHKIDIVQSNLKGSGDYEKLAKFLNPFTKWTDQKKIVEAFEWVRSAREYDKLIPIGLPTQYNFKVYTPVLLYRICKRNKFKTTPDMSVIELRNILSPPPPKPIFNPEADKSAYSPDQLSDFLIEEGYDPDEVVDKFAKLVELHALPTFRKGFPSHYHFLKHNKEDKFSREIDYENCLALGPRDRLSINQISNISTLPPSEGEYTLYTVDELFHFFSQNRRLIDPYKKEEFPEHITKKLQKLTKGTKLYEIIRENKKTYKVLKDYISKLKKWYSSFDKGQTTVFAGFIECIDELGNQYDRAEPGREEKISQIKKDISDMGAFLSLKTIDCFNEDYILRSVTISYLINEEVSNTRIGTILRFTAHVYKTNLL